MSEQNIPFKKKFFGFDPENVMAYLEELLKNRDFDQIRIDRLEKDLQTSTKRIAELEQALAEAKKATPVQENKCENCDVQKKAQSLLGETMIDVKRFSSCIVDEANQKANNILSYAKKNAVDASDRAKAMMGEVDDFVDDFNSRIDSLRSVLSGLTDGLDAFSDGIKIEQSPDADKKSIDSKDDDSFGFETSEPDFSFDGTAVDFEKTDKKNSGENGLIIDSSNKNTGSTLFESGPVKEVRHADYVELKNNVTPVSAGASDEGGDVTPEQKLIIDFIDSL